MPAPTTLKAFAYALFGAMLLVAQPGLTRSVFAQEDAPLADDSREKRVEIAEELVADTIASKLADNLLASMWAPAEKSLRENNPAIDDEVLEELRDSLATQTSEMIDELTAAMPGVFAQYFTASELQQIYDFQTSDIGRKALEVQPKILGALMPKILQSVQERTPKILQSIRAKAAEKGLKL